MRSCLGVHSQLSLGLFIALKQCVCCHNMILPSRLVLLFLLAVVTFGASAQSASVARTQRFGTHAEKQLKKEAKHATLQLFKAAKAAGRTPQMRAAAGVQPETKTYLALTEYSWTGLPGSDTCADNAANAVYHGTGCVPFEGGVSARYNCVLSKWIQMSRASSKADCHHKILTPLLLSLLAGAEGTDSTTGKQMGELQLQVFSNTKCKNTPISTTVEQEFVVVSNRIRPHKEPIALSRADFTHFGISCCAGFDLEGRMHRWQKA